ncbi:hypothetical protein [Massilia sp. Root351]|uniref:hypothetical protein n=1 Tax=Massilia sp. Root351 TaxID=1736522 RepID=UPI0012F6394B
MPRQVTPDQHTKPGEGRQRRQRIHQERHGNTGQCRQDHPPDTDCRLRAGKPPDDQPG